MKIYVTYHVKGQGLTPDGEPKKFESGPYDNWSEAAYQRRDIEGYEGVYGVDYRYEEDLF